VMTGAHPGHHGVLHNAWWDREHGRQIITNDPAQWATAMENLLPGVQTIHEALREHEPEVFTVSINEPCDRGASWSTFALMRAGVRMSFPKVPEDLPHATERFVRPFKDYGWYTRVDHHGMEQAVGILRGSYLGVEHPQLPRFMWINITLTDSAFHEGGPHSEIARASLVDTDGRIGEVLAALDDRGVFDRCAFYVVADHGMEQSDPTCTGDWDAALTAAGIDFRDEAYGFVYLDPMSPDRAV
jgi:phosphonoacetate hydrolase